MNIATQSASFLQTQLLDINKDGNPVFEFMLFIDGKKTVEEHVIGANRKDMFLAQYGLIPVGDFKSMPRRKWRLDVVPAPSTEEIEG